MRLIFAYNVSIEKCEDLEGDGPNKEEILMVGNRNGSVQPDESIASQPPGVRYLGALVADVVDWQYYAILQHKHFESSKKNPPASRSKDDSQIVPHVGKIIHGLRNEHACAYRAMAPKG